PGYSMVLERGMTGRRALYERLLWLRPPIAVTLAIAEREDSIDAREQRGAFPQRTSASTDPRFADCRLPAALAAGDFDGGAAAAAGRGDGRQSHTRGGRRYSGRAR